MALTSYPFHPITHDLLPGYRDAYLRGDLSGKNTELVDAYLKANPAKGSEAFKRFHSLKEKGHAVRPVGWLQQQLHLLRTEPQRFYRRAGSLVLAAALLGGAAFASDNLHIAPGSARPNTVIVSRVSEEIFSAAKAATWAKTSTVTGKVLNQYGYPLVGATVLDKVNGRGVSTNAEGNYMLVVPANEIARLQVGYGGYREKELQVKGHAVQNVTLLPRPSKLAKKRSHWWHF